MEKINIAELLKDCPKGMELDCLMFDNLVFSEIDSEAQDYPIVTQLPNGALKWFASDGRYEVNPNAKCVIFPKGKTTWEGFVPPCKFKNGDVISNALGTCIFKGEGRFKGTVDYYCGISPNYFRVKDYKHNPDEHYGNIVDYRFATEEEKEKLFQAIKDNGYKWDAETKTLEILVDPKFKDGDILFIKADFSWVFVYKESEYKESLCKYVGIPYRTNDTYIVYDENPICRKEDISEIRLATEEEKQKLFQVIKENGYTWNAYTKTLEKLVLPKFKIGDCIRLLTRDIGVLYTVTRMTDTHYLVICDGKYVYEYTIPISKQDNYEKVSLKFDYKTLVPFESKVLIRNDKMQKWIPSFWGYKTDKDYITTFGWCRYCIPYEGNEHLLGTSDDCDDKYKTW